LVTERTEMYTEVTSSNAGLLCVLWIGAPCPL